MARQGGTGKPVDADWSKNTASRRPVYATEAVTRERVAECTTPEELYGLAREEGMELSADDLEKIVGGEGNKNWDVGPHPDCPKCNRCSSVKRDRQSQQSQ